LRDLYEEEQKTVKCCQEKTYCKEKKHNENFDFGNIFQVTFRPKYSKYSIEKIQKLSER